MHLTKSDLLRRLNQIADRQTAHRNDRKDEVNDHIEADALLLEYIRDPAIRDAYDRIAKWYD